MAITEYYSPAAYRSDKGVGKVNRERLYKKGLADRASSLGRPWGNATTVVPTRLFRHKTPDDLRNPHEESELDRKIQNESREDHESIVHAPYPFRIRAAIISESIGRIAFYVLTPLALLVSGLGFWVEGGGGWLALFESLKDGLPFFL